MSRRSAPSLQPGLALALALCAAPLPAAALSDASADLFCGLTTNTAILDGVESEAFETIADSGNSGSWGWQCEAEAVENGPLARVSGGSGPMGTFPTEGRMFVESEVTVPFEVVPRVPLPPEVPVPAGVNVTILMRGEVENASSPDVNQSNASVFFNLTGQLFTLRGFGDSMTFLQMNMGSDGACDQSWNDVVDPQCDLLALAQASLMEGVEHAYQISAGGVSTTQQASLSAWIDPVVAVDPEQELAPGVLAGDYYEVVVAPNIVQSVPEPGAAGLVVVAVAACAWAWASGRRRPRAS